MDDLSEEDMAFYLSMRHGGGFASADRLQQIGESNMDDLTEDDMAFYLSMRHNGGHVAGGQRIADVAEAINKNPLTVSAKDLETIKRHQAENDRRKAETMAGVGMSKVEVSTRNNPIVTCQCTRCHETFDSILTIPSDRVQELFGYKGRRIQVFGVDEGGNKIGDDPLYTLDHASAVADQLKADNATVNKVAQSSEEGGLLKKYGENRPQEFWLRYEPRRRKMIVAPRCKKDGCHSTTEPTDTKLRCNVDYAKYQSLSQRWKKEEEKELRELCDSLGIVVKKGATKKTLLAKLEEHYNPKQK